MYGLTLSIYESKERQVKHRLAIEKLPKKITWDKFPLIKNLLLALALSMVPVSGSQLCSILISKWYSPSFSPPFLLTRWARTHLRLWEVALQLGA